ncbi:MAG: SanA protein [Bacteroidia bacterium]|jgi:SanA protein
MKKRIKKKLIILPVLLIVVILGTDYYVSQSTQKQVFTEIQLLPKNRVGLLLGTGKFVNHGAYINRYYTYRIQATWQLYKAGKIEFVLISGDNSREDYDEPSTMKADLVALGIPEDRIYLDYAGFRTLDSVVRGKKVFDLDKFTIISQKFHNERAVFIANHKGLKTVSFCAKGVSAKYGVKVVLREKLARVKMLLDLLLNVQPKFLGKKVEIG